MNIHAILDKFVIGLSALAAGKNTFFCKSIDSPAFSDHLQNVDLQFPEIKNPGKYEVVAETLAGQLDAAFWIAQWKGNSFPIIIYHHGSNERPFDTGWAAKNSFKNIFLSGSRFAEVNLIALRAPFHNDSTGDYMRKMGYLNNFTAMNAVSVKLIEALVSYYKPFMKNAIIVSGISLGGWATNLHRAYYNSADAYIPVMAGAALNAVFTSSVYRKLTGKLARQNPQVLKTVLNFEEEFRKISADNVFPLLAAYDQIITYERQRKCYGKRAVNVLEKGHISGALAYGEIRQHFLAVTDSLRRS
ncbi:MAG: hypothetical protein GXO77_10615 [Calditrichaeota bacterium]|nr:hypothetical protein [Calditrichota bacterium]